MGAGDRVLVGDSGGERERAGGVHAHACAPGARAGGCYLVLCTRDVGEGRLAHDVHCWIGAAAKQVGARA